MRLAGIRLRCRRVKMPVPRWFKVLPWTLLLAQILVTSGFIILSTAAGQSAQEAERLSCKCRIAHTQNQTQAWVLMVVLQLCIWLFITRPLTIAAGILTLQVHAKQR